MAKAKKKFVLLDARGTPIEQENDAKEQASVALLPARTNTNLLEALSRTIADPASQPEKLHVLLDARKRLMEEEAEVEFEDAYLTMHDELPVINADGRIVIGAKSGSSPTGRQSSKQDTPYASYLNIQRITKPILKRNGFNLHTTPDVGPDGTGIVMRGKLARVCDTQYGKLVWAKTCAIPTTIEASGSKNQAQGITSGISYAKRQCAVVLLDLVSEAKEDKDNDGNTTGSKKRVADPESQEKPESKVDRKQIDALIDVMESCGVSRETFCDKYGIAAVKDLPAARYADAVAACKSYAEAVANARKKS